MLNKTNYLLFWLSEKSRLYNRQKAKRKILISSNAPVARSEAKYVNGFKSNAFVNNLCLFKKFTKNCPILHKKATLPNMQESGGNALATSVDKIQRKSITNSCTENLVIY